MSISNDSELAGIRKISEIVALTVREMKAYASAGMSTKELDDYGKTLLEKYHARSAPLLTYKFPGCTCISLNGEIAHGIPSDSKVLREGDLINIDVSAELDGFWADNGASFVIGEDINNHFPLINASRAILKKAISNIRGGVRVSDIGGLIELEAKKSGYRVIKNLTGHGIGRSLHEAPEVANYRDNFNKQRFAKNQVVAVETFISTLSTIADTTEDGWTLTGNKGGFVAQFEHTILVTSGLPVILTESNGIFE